MLRFTIRELLLLTVIVALGVGWALRERQLDHLKRWKTGAEILERVLEERGSEVTWYDDGVAVGRSEGRAGAKYHFDGGVFLLRE